MRKPLITAVASSVLLFATAAVAQTARARISDTPIRAEANLASPVIATMRIGDPVDVVDVQGDWYRVLVPTEQDNPRVGYVLSRLIEIVNPTNSPGSQPATPRPRVESNLPQSQIAPTAEQLAKQRDLATEAERQLKARTDATQVELSAVQSNQPVGGGRSNSEPPISAEMGSKSTSSGFFIGLGLEGNAIVPTENGVSGVAESGGGVGMVPGYGFNPHWSIYGMLSGASIDAADFSGSYGLGHFDLVRAFISWLVHIESYRLFRPVWPGVQSIRNSSSDRANTRWRQRVRERSLVAA